MSEKPTKSAEQNESEAKSGLGLSDHRLRYLLEATSQIVWSTNAQGQMVEDVPTWQSFSGMTAEECSGYGWTQAIHPSDYERLKPIWQKSLEEKTRFEFEARLKGKDGIWRHFQVCGVPILNDQDQVQEWIGFCSDVTAKIEYERALLESEKQFKSMAANLPGMLHTLLQCPDGTIASVYASDGAFELYEIDPYEIMSGTLALLKLMHPEDSPDFWARFKMCSDRFISFRWEGRFILASGVQKWIRVVASPREANDGYTLWDGFHMDITQEKNQSLGLIQRSRMASLGEMAGGIAHEINNPLAIISGRAGFLKHQIEAGQFDAQSAVAVLDKIESVVQRITKIIRGLRSFSRNAEEDPFAKSSLKTIIDETLELCQERFRNHNVELRSHHFDDVLIECRASQLGQVFLNLLNNAHDAVNGKPNSWVDIRVERTPERVRVIVSDSGLGIPSAVADKIMQPFFTTKEVGKGTGLGLSISKGIVETHHGELSIDTAARNTTFVVDLPIQRGERTEAAVDFDQVLKEHMLWRRKLAGFFGGAGEEVFEEQVAHDCCSFHSWIRSQPEVTRDSFFQSLDHAHREFHRSMAQLIRRRKDGERLSVEDLLDPKSDFAKASRTFVEYLSLIREKTRDVA